jgi:flagellar M-ring protein FliF
VELKDRLAGLVRTLPPAQRAGLAVAAVVLLMAAVPFVQWVATPSYTLLYAGLEDRELAEVTSELDAQNISYQLDGSRVLVPHDQVHRVRANLAEAGVSATPVVPGYELLDDQALGLSDFRQRVDLQRAVEGELVRTLTAMDAIETATVRLVMPEEALFTDRQTPPSASVLVRTFGQLDRQQTQAITLLIASAVEGLEADNVTIADTNGQVLHAPGDGTVGGVTDRQQQRAREFEQALSHEITELLQRATDAPASVVVRAALDFDEIATETETYEEGGVPLREQTSNERYEGTGPAVGGIVGVDGGPLPEAGGGEGNYERDEAVREFGVDRTVTRTVQAPGEVRRLSVALVVDEDAAVGNAALLELVGAAAGIDAERGDEIAITRVATPVMAEPSIEGDGPALVDLIQRIVALVVLVVIAVALFLMSRRRSKVDPEPERVVPAKVRPTPQLEEQVLEEIPTSPSKKDEVSELVEKQPEEIAALLRGWLADRRVDA